MAHPDQVFELPNVDQEEQSNAQDTHRDSLREEDIAPPEKVEQQDEPGEVAEGDAEGEMEAEESEYDDDGNKIEKKKVVAPVIVKKDKSGRISSDKDQMIELTGWTQTVIQSSATVLCFANYREAFVNISSIDMKTRRKQNLKTFHLNAKPTKIFQIDDNNMLFGTEGGKIEHWKIDEGACQKIYDAHPESEAGISSIIEIQSKSPLLRGEEYKEGEAQEFRLLATASSGAKEFRLWRLNNATKEL